MQLILRFNLEIMIDNIIRSFIDTRFVRHMRAKTVPRWLILLVDMFLVSCSYLIFIASDMYTRPGINNFASIMTGLCIILVVYFIVTYISKSYTCIIRLSVIEDLYREFIVVFSATLILLALNVATKLLFNFQLFRFWCILFTGVLSFTSLTIERLMIKHIYSVISTSSRKRKKVMVLGTNLRSLILANALKSEIDGKYEPVALLTRNENNTNTSINGFKVYHFDPETVASYFSENRIHALIFDSEDIHVMRGAFADVFIDNGISLLLINNVEEYDNEPRGQNESDISTHVKEVQIEDLLGRDPIVLNNTLVRSHIKNSVVLITGACGSIGSEIVRQVATYKASKIVLIDQAETPMHEMQLELQKNFPDASIELFVGDIQNYERMEVAFNTFKPKFVLHAAAYKHVPMMELNPTEAVMTNVLGTKNIADLSLKYDVRKFVLVSTDKAVNPSNIMGCTKRLAEIYCQSLFFDSQKQGSKTQFITTRFGNVLGSNGSVIPLFRKQIQNGGPLTVTHRDIIRYFMTIPEACSLVLEAGCMGNGGEIYIFDMGEPVKIYDLAVRMISLAGLKPDKDIKIEEIGLRPGEKLYEELLNDKEKTISTDNEKIMVAKVRKYDYQEVCENISVIVSLARTNDIHDMILEMKRFVPEFKSMHSAFESIDREIEKEPQGNKRAAVSYYFNSTTPTGSQPSA